MKKKLCFLLACCLILATSAFCVNATETLYEAREGKAYHKGYMSLLLTTSVDPSDYVGEGPFDFFGIPIVEFEYRASSGLSGDRDIYYITVSPEVDTFEACETLNNTEGVELATMALATFMHDVDHIGNSSASPSVYADMTEDERKNERFFVPDEVTVCLDYELDLAEFEGEGEHYLFGVSVADISRVEDADGFVYQIKYGKQQMENYYAVRVFRSNEHVLWTEFKSTYGNGDVNKDGKLDSVDYVLIKRSLFDTFDMTYYTAGYSDFNFDGTVDSVDYLLLKRACFNTYTVDEQERIVHFDPIQNEE